MGNNSGEGIAMSKHRCLVRIMILIAFCGIQYSSIRAAESDHKQYENRIKQIDKQLERLHEGNPERDKLLLNKSYALMHLGKLQPARDILLPLANKSNKPDLFRHLAACEKKLGNKEAADGYLRKADELEGKATWYVVRVLCMKVGNGKSDNFHLRINPDGGENIDTPTKQGPAINYPRDETLFYVQWPGSSVTITCRAVGFWGHKYDAFSEIPTGRPTKDRLVSVDNWVQFKITDVFEEFGLEGTELPKGFESKLKSRCSLVEIWTWLRGTYREGQNWKNMLRACEEIHERLLMGSNEEAWKTKFPLAVKLMWWWTEDVANEVRAYMAKHRHKKVLSANMALSGEALFHLKRYDESIKAYVDAAMIDESHEYWQGAAKSAEESGNNEKALEYYCKALETCGKQDQARYRGLVHDILYKKDDKKHWKALGSLCKSILEHTPKGEMRSYVFYYLARAYKKQQLWDESLGAAIKAIEQYNRQGEFHWIAGQAAKELKRNEEARKYFRKAKSLLTRKDDLEAIEKEIAELGAE
jgi:tetratricopeptide (TPR) repeat protein